MSRQEKIEFAVTFVLENQEEDKGTVVELLKDEGLSGGEIMEALAEAASRGAR